MAESLPTNPDYPEPSDSFGADPVVWFTVDAMSSFGADLDRPTVETLLPIWHHFGKLTPDQVEAVLAAFPVSFPVRRSAPGRIVDSGSHWIDTGSGPGHVRRNLSAGER